MYAKEKGGREKKKEYKVGWRKIVTKSSPNPSKRVFSFSAEEKKKKGRRREKKSRRRRKGRRRERRKRGDESDDKRRRRTRKQEWIEKGN